jgi:hypothetical protein
MIPSPRMMHNVEKNIIHNAHPRMIEIIRFPPS